MTSDDAIALVDCLKQLKRTNYSIAGCDQWHHLLQLLPRLVRANVTNHSPCSGISAVGPTALSSTALEVAAAAEQLLLNKLAPEVLDCSPEPLAQLLIAFLSTSCHILPLQKTSNPQDPLSSHSTKAEQQSYSNLPEGVVQLLVVGLHKIARQWHFLEQGTSMQLCNAVVKALTKPLELLLESEMDHPHAQANLQQQQQAENTLPSHLGQSLQQQEQQQLPNNTVSATDAEGVAVQDKNTCCCLAEQLLLRDPSMGWLHRLNACSSSGRPFRQSMQESGLIQQLIRCVVKLYACGWLMGEACEAAEQACKRSQQVQVHQHHSSDSAQHLTGHPQQYSKQQLRRCSIIAAHLLTTLIETRAGRLSVRTVHQTNDLHDFVSDRLKSTGEQTITSDTLAMPDIVSKLVDAIKQAGELYSSLQSSAAASVGAAALGKSVVTAACTALAAWAEQCAEQQDVISLL